MLQNPYNPLGILWQDNHKVVGRVSQEDFYFLKQKFPYYPGLQDKLISTLYKAVIDELRKRDQQTPLATALYIDDPSYRILDEVVSSLTRVEGRSVGEHSAGGPAAPQHDTGTADGVRAEMQRTAEQRTDTEGSPASRERSPEGTEKKEKQRRTSSRTVGTAKERTRKRNKEVT